MNKIYGITLIGCGKMGHTHLSRICERDNIRINCVCDRNIERAEHYKKVFGAAKASDNAEECIKDPGTDIVIIATYPSTHIEMLKICLENGKHALCEKPIADTLEKGEEFYRLVKSHPECKVLVGNLLRHCSAYQKAAEMIQSGVIGKPVVIRLVHNHHTMDWARYKNLIEETSPLIDCGVHYTDICQWFTGEKIEQVSALGACTEPDLPKGKYNYSMMTMRLSGGSVAYYEAGWSNTLTAASTREFAGPKGSIRIMDPNERPSHQEEGELIELYRYPERKYEIININEDARPTDKQIEYLIKMIEEDAPAVPSMEEIMECFRALFEGDRQIKEML